MPNEAQRIMAAGGRWQEGMRFRRDGAVIGRVYEYDVDFKTGPFYGHCIPDLNDGPTCRALWDQLRERVDALYVHQMGDCTQVSIRIGERWFQSLGGPEPEELAAAYEWVAEQEKEQDHGA